MCYNDYIINILTKEPTDKLIQMFFKKGGYINKYYLRTPIIKKPGLVYLNGWFAGQNIRLAILKALGQK